MQSADQLNEIFALPDVLVFDEPQPGMPRARVSTPACTGEFYLQGAHLTAWQPTGAAPVLFLSERSHFAPGKAIRGGVPIIFPWFGAAETSPVQVPAGSPQHGFARTAAWTLRFAALAGEDLHLSATLDQTEAMRALGLGTFELGCEIVLGRTLKLRLSVLNTGETPFLFEEALHAYLAVGDSEEVAVTGLAGTSYLDKTDNMARKCQQEPTLHFSGQVDRPYLGTEAPLALSDPALGRTLHLVKTGSASTVTWNPGEELAATLADLALGAWRQFVCLETANVGENAILLRPKEAHTVEMQLSVEAERAGELG